MIKLKLSQGGGKPKTKQDWKLKSSGAGFQLGLGANNFCKTSLGYFTFQPGNNIKKAKNLTFKWVFLEFNDFLF